MADKLPMLPNDLHLLPHASRAAMRAGGISRQAALACAASKAVHLAAAAALYVLAGSDLLSVAPPQGEASIELTAVFSAASPPAAELPVEIAEVQTTDSPSAAVPTSSETAIERDLSAPSTIESVVDSHEIEVPASEIGELPSRMPVVRRRPSEPALSEPAADQSAPAPRQVAAPPEFVATQPAVAAATTDSAASSGSQADTLPVASFQPAPVYPPELLQAGIQGTVTCRLTIAADGSVAEAELERSSGYAAMDRAALEAVRQWRFTPARRLGVAVPIEVRKRFPFVIQRQP